MMKHMENTNLGRNVGLEEKCTDYPVTLKIYETNNCTSSSSDDDDPFNILRGKCFPRDDQHQLHIQEKFTMPQVSLGIEAVPNIHSDTDDIVDDNNNNIKINLDKSKELEEIVSNCTQKDHKQGRPYSRFSIDSSKHLQENANFIMDVTRNRIEQYELENDNEKNCKMCCQHKLQNERLLSKSEEIGDRCRTKDLMNRLVSKCRTLTMEQLYQKDNTVRNISKEVVVKDNRKVRSVWDWKPKKELPKVGCQLDTSTLKIPVKLSNFLKLFKQFCIASCSDMKVIIDDTVFHCHKIVLQCYSKFFQTHIRSKGFKKEVMIEIPHGKVNKNVFMDIYIWMLNSPKHCRNNFSNYNILNLLIGSAFLKIDELEKHCWNYISDINNFDEGTAFDLYWEARHANYWPVMELMITRIKFFFLTLVQTDKFTKLSENELHLLLDSNLIAVHCEIEVFFSLILWLRKNNQTDPWECSLFRLIRFSQMSPIQLVELQSMSELHYITKRYPVGEMIESGLRTAIRREHALNNGQVSFNDPEPQARNWLKKTVVYKSFNEFVDCLIRKRNIMRKPNCELMRRETLESLKIPQLQLWTPIVRSSSS